MRLSLLLVKGHREPFTVAVLCVWQTLSLFSFILPGAAHWWPPDSKIWAVEGRILQKMSSNDIFDAAGENLLIKSLGSNVEGFTVRFRWCKLTERAEMTLTFPGHVHFSLRMRTRLVSRLRSDDAAACWWLGWRVTFAAGKRFRVYSSVYVLCIKPHRWWLGLNITTVEVFFTHFTLTQSVMADYSFYLQQLSTNCCDDSLFFF